MPTTKHKAYLALMATSIVWGTTWVAMKMGVKGMPPLQLAAIRQLMGGTFLVVMFLIRGHQMPDIHQLLRLLGIGIFTFVIANGLATLSLSYISSGLGALIAALYPLCVVMIEFVFFKNKNITWTTVVGIFLGFSGIALVFYDNAFHTNVSHAHYFWGVVLATVSMLAWSISTILIAKAKMQVSPYMGIGWQMLFSGIILYTYCLVTHTHIPIVQIPAISWWSIVYLVVLGSVITMMAFVYTMKNLPTAVAALYAYINPIVAVFVGFFLLNEVITLNIILGSVITVVGVYIVKWSMTKAAAKIAAA
jgi:drug/metabolite transporter (DMT)-like permease